MKRGREDSDTLFIGRESAKKLKRIDSFSALPFPEFLPEDILWIVCSYLGCKEYANVRRVSKRFSSVLCRYFTALDLSLASARVDDAVLKSVAPCKNLRKLDLNLCCGITAEGFEFLREFEDLRELDLLCSLVTDTSLQVIGSLQNLTSLNLTHCPISTISSLSNLSSLKVLILRDFQCEPQIGLKPLTNLSELRILDLFGAKQINDAQLKDLPSSITNLDLSFCSITNDGVRELKPLLSLSILRLYACAEVNDDGVEFIADTFPMLKVLDIGFTKITDKGAAILAEKLGAVLQEVCVAGCELLTKGLLQLLALPQLRVETAETMKSHDHMED